MLWSTIVLCCQLQFVTNWLVNLLVLFLVVCDDDDDDEIPITRSQRKRLNRCMSKS